MGMRPRGYLGEISGVSLSGAEAKEPKHGVHPGQGKSVVDCVLSLLSEAGDDC